MLKYEDYLTAYKKQVALLYAEYGCKTLGKQLGVSPTTILSWVREQNVEIRIKGKSITSQKSDKKLTFQVEQVAIQWKATLEHLEIDDYVRIEQPLKPHHKGRAKATAKKLNIKINVIRLDPTAFLIQRTS